MADRLANSKILVTGATGFLGASVVEQLRARGCQLWTTGRRAVHPGTMPRYTAVDLCDASAVARIVDGVDTIIHAAGLAHQHHAAPSHGSEFFRVNALGTANLARAAVAAGCRRLVLVSSVAVYGSGTPPKTEGDPCLPTSAYARSKLEAEQLAASVIATTNMELIILRMATMYGENDPGNVGRLLRTIDRGRFVWIGNGRNSKTLVHVTDAARACVAAAACSHLPCVRTFNVAASPCTMRSIVTEIAHALGRRVPPIQLPARLPLTAAAFAGRMPRMADRAQRFAATLEKWISNDIYDATAFREAFGWQPTITLEAGLSRQVTHYRAASAPSGSRNPSKSGNWLAVKSWYW